MKLQDAKELLIGVYGQEALNDLELDLIYYAPELKKDSPHYNYILSIFCMGVLNMFREGAYFDPESYLKGINQEEMLTDNREKT